MRTYLVCLFTLFASVAICQVKLEYGPEFGNIDGKMSRMIGSDENSFYCYRVKTRGHSDGLVVEKYDKSSLDLLFSKEVVLGQDDRISVQEITYSAGNIFIFMSKYDKVSNQTILFYRTISETGEIDKSIKEVTSLASKKIEYDFIYNKKSSKFLIKATYKVQPDSPYVTDFIIYDLIQKDTFLKKVIRQKLKNTSFTGYGMQFSETTYTGLYLDSLNNIYYSYTLDGNYPLYIGILRTEYKSARPIKLDFGEFQPTHMSFFSLKQDELIVVGYLLRNSFINEKFHQRAGVFCYRINSTNGDVISRSIKPFDDKLLEDLGYTNENSLNMDYKLDYIVEKNGDIYLIGEQYSEIYKGSTVIYGVNLNQFDYKYMDIIITKFDKKDTVEWIRTFPYLFDIHNATDETLYTEYIAAVDSNIYLIHNENIENPMFPNNQGIKPGEFKPVGRIHGSNLVCSIINKEGNLVNKSVLMKNENYCFSPQRNRIGVLSPPSGNDVFIQDEENIFIYTEDRGKPRFVRVDIK